MTDAKWHVDPTVEDEPPPVRADKPMCWALDKESRHLDVSELDREHTGLRCDCICPGCEAVLQAANAGLDGSHFSKKGTGGMSFRHHTGHQKDRCLLLAARMAALELLFKRQEIDIPPPRRRASIHGASGQIFSAEAVGQRELVRIRAREWVDSQAARLTLEDGRVILLTLDSSFAVDDAGVYSGVITIRVNDPAIASWTREEILANAVVDDGLLCWQRHWQDQALEAEAMRQAEDAAVQLLDHLPGRGQDYEGLTVAQRSESVLHGAIRMILEKAGGLTVPPYAFEEKVALLNGKTWSETYGFQFGFLRMVDVRLEKVLGRIVPDVLCRACTQEDDFPLMIEVIVTPPRHAGEAAAHPISGSCLPADRRVALPEERPDDPRGSQVGGAEESQPSAGTSSRPCTPVRSPPSSSACGIPKSTLRRPWPSHFRHGMPEFRWHSGCSAASRLTSTRSGSCPSCSAQHGLSSPIPPSPTSSYASIT
ncbi:MAG: hypothetical protein EOP24_32925 [Hyphomicrobiales bacterium]|nr:MAG: hypothetical protein EOP24_32925 [Hyphomicrobiales bacterium]